MKKVKHLFLALCLCIGLLAGSAGQASALDVRVSGVMDYLFGLDSYNGFMNNDDVGYASGDTFWARFRSRIQLELAVSENLKGVLQFQAGTWGFGEAGFAVDGNKNAANIRRAYLDWTTESAPLQFKIGLQQIAMPGYVAGNPFFNANVAGVVGTAGLADGMHLSAFWARPWSSPYGTGGTSTDAFTGNNADVFGLLFDAKIGGFQITPWAVYANIGNRSGYWSHMFSQIDTAADWYGHDSNIYAGGLSLEVKPSDALTIKFDGMYAALDNEARGKNGYLKTENAIETRGWFVALSADYQLESFTPGIFAWYTSGDDDKDSAKGKFGRMAQIGGEETFFYPTRLGLAGSYTAGHDSWLSFSGLGTWGAGLKFADISFVEDLSHTVRLSYIGGTNDKFDLTSAEGRADYSARLDKGQFYEGVYLTRKDYAVELNLDSQYQVYENLLAILELGYIYLDVDNDRRSNAIDTEYSRHNGYNAQVTLSYQF